MIDPLEVLNLELPPNDADARTVRDYLKALVLTVWVEDEGFSGKRPFGNSGWFHELLDPVEQHFGVEDGNSLIEAAIGAL